MSGTCAIPLNFGIRLGDENDWENNNGFMRRHPGGGHFVMTDGSVRFLSESIDLELYRGLATIQGNEVIGEF